MEAMTIQGTQIQIKEYKGKRVVTFKDIDTVHQRSDGTARKRFNDNRKRFVSGVDFYKINQPSEIRTLGITRPQGGTPQEATLITESGYLMLVKSFTDDLAWKVQRDLVDTYFRVRAEPEVMQQTVTITEPIQHENPEIFLEAARILSNVPGCKNEIINCLRHVVLDIDFVEKQEKVTEIRAEVKALPDKKRNNRFFTLGVDIDREKLITTMVQKNLSKQEVARRANVSVITVGNWIDGKQRPVLQNRINLCVALGEDENFLTPKRTRNKK